MTGQADNSPRPTFSVNKTKRRQTGVTLPKQGSRSYALLQALLSGPGTFYQICERAGFDIEEAGMEHRLRMIFSRFIQGNVRLAGIRYVLKDASRCAAGRRARTGWPGCHAAFSRHGGRNARCNRPSSICGGTPMKAINLFPCAGGFSTGATMVGRNVASPFKEQD